MLIHWGAVLTAYQACSNQLPLPLCVGHGHGKWSTNVVFTCATNRWQSPSHNQPICTRSLDPAAVITLDSPLVCALSSTVLFLWTRCISLRYLFRLCQKVPLYCFNTTDDTAQNQCNRRSAGAFQYPPKHSDAFTTDEATPLLCLLYLQCWDEQP